MLDKQSVRTAASELFDRATKLTIARQMPPGELFTIASNLKLLGETRLAADLYKSWIAYHGAHELLYVVYFNYGTALSDAGDRPGAVNAFRECIRLKPDFYPPYINLGRVLEDMGLAGDAVNQWLELVKALPLINGEAVKHKLVALHQIGRVLENNFSDAAAEDALRQSLEINLDQDEIIQHWIAIRQRQCKWPVMAGWEADKKTRIIAGISPLSLANFTDDPMFQLAAAYRYNKRSIGLAPAGLPHHAGADARQRHARLRIGYVSSDLREHAVGFAMTDVFETHDRTRFEIYAYYCGISRVDPTQKRIQAAADHWLDINAMTDEEVAEKIRDDEIDILIDLNGYTKSARTRVFCLRPAPVAVNWFGFPGSMGSPYHHYIIADAYIIPPDRELYYSEKVARLACYQPNDRKRVVDSHRPTRAEVGLPEQAFVYCCFNGTQKLTALTLHRWFNILEQVPNSVLWLLSSTQDTNEILRQRAAGCGIDPSRLIFADKKANPQHLARYPLADLFLDNLPYGAHTTAADALWMGVPVLTLPGRSFAARVCASLVQAAGLEELICSGPEDYVARAIALGRDPAQLASIKEKLAAGRETCLLFDTPRLVAQLERLFEDMWIDFEQGTLPVPDLRNLDVYHEVALDLDHENSELLDDQRYRELYIEKLAHWHATYPLQPDRRFWPASKALGRP